MWYLQKCLALQNAILQLEHVTLLCFIYSCAEESLHFLITISFFWNLIEYELFYEFYFHVLDI
jgi:hypothetical protein